jgi:acyl-CoA thioester hydrolase
LDNQAMESSTEIRVRYAETDAMGIVHHAVYPVWMELGRSDLLRQLGQSYAEWETAGIRITVGEIRVKYRAPARYDELVVVRSRIREASRRKLVFGYRIERDGAVLAVGESVHLICGSDGRARVLPEPYLALVQGALSPAG